MTPLVNWRELSRMRLVPRAGAPGADVDWDGHAEMYARMVELERSYTAYQIDAIPTRPTDTVLDIGCGPGRIAVPIARRVRRVTALDSFPLMLGKCREYAAVSGVTNVDFLQLDWNDIAVGKGAEGRSLDRHDVVICSRTAALDDLEKVSALAGRLAAVVVWANAPAIPSILNRLFAGAAADRVGAPGPPADRALGYNVLFNIVYDMGFEPNVTLVRDGFARTFADAEEAYGYLRPLRPILPGAEAEQAFRANVDTFTTSHPDGSLTFRVETRSVVLWWETRQEDYSRIWT